MKKNCFDQPVKKNMKTFDKIRKIAIGQRNDYAIVCLLDYIYIKEHYKMIAIDLSKQQALDADPNETQQSNITGNLERINGEIKLFITE